MRPGRQRFWHHAFVARKWLDTAVGPDGDRVTFIIEPRLDRLFSWMATSSDYDSIHIFPSLGERLAKAFPGDKQRALLGNAWLLRIESDSGKKVTLRIASQQDAEDRAAQIGEAVNRLGVVALSDLT